jgi:hypothetical protein
MKRLITICLAVVLLGTGYAWAGTWTTMPDIPGQTSIYADGESGGTIVGTWGGGGSSHGFVYAGGSYTSLDYPGNPGPYYWTFFNGIQGNMVVGDHGITGWTFEGLTYNISTQTWTNVVSPFSGFPDMHLRGIDGDKLVGWVWDGQQDHGQNRAVLYDGTSWSIIQPPGSPSAGAWGISGNTIVGYYDDSGWVEHGFIYDGTNYTTIDGPGATATFLCGISGRYIAGTYADASNVDHGLLYDGTAWMTLDMPGAKSTDFYGFDGDTVLGNYTDASGMQHGLTYTIPEPATLVFLGLGGLTVMRRRRAERN